MKLYDNSYLPEKLRYDKVKVDIEHIDRKTVLAVVDTGYGEKNSVKIIFGTRSPLSQWDEKYTTHCYFHGRKDRCHHENCRYIRLVFQKLKMKTHPSIYWSQDRKKELIREKKFMLSFLTENDIPLLDVGCWTHWYSEFFPMSKDQIYGIDTYRDAAGVAKIINASDNYFASAMNRLPFKDSFFRAIVSFEVVEHIETEVFKKFLLEAKRVLKKNGILYLSTPNGVLWNKDHISCPTHKKEYSLQEIKKLTEDAGFKLLFCKGYGVLGPKRKLIEKFLYRFLTNIEEKETNPSRARTLLYKIQK